MSAQQEEGSYQPSEMVTDPLEPANATEHDPEQQPADKELVTAWKDLDDEAARILQAEFVAWFQEQGGREVFKTVRNVFLDGLKTSYMRRELQLGLPGHPSGEGDAAASVWNRLAVDDPGWEVRNAMRSLNEAQAEILFLR